MIDRLARLGADYRILADRLEQESDPSIRQALILALGEFDAGKLSEQERRTLVIKLSAFYRNDPDPGVHSAAGWTLRQYEAVDTVARLDDELRKTELEKTATKDNGTNRRWFINSQGQTFIVVDRPVPSLTGDQRGPNRAASVYRFAMATHEVTVAQFMKFTASYVQIRRYAPEPDCPATTVTWFAAAAYCNWLSQQEGIPKEEWCYERNDNGDYAAGMRIHANFLRRTGYRLPTETEWQDVCRGEYPRHRFLVRRAAGIVAAVCVVRGQLTQPNLAGWQLEAERIWACSTCTETFGSGVRMGCSRMPREPAARAKRSSPIQTVCWPAARSTIARMGSMPHTPATPKCPSMATTSVSARSELIPNQRLQLLIGQPIPLQPGA